MFRERGITARISIADGEGVIIEPARPIDTVEISQASPPSPLYTPSLIPGIGTPQTPAKKSTRRKP